MTVYIDNARRHYRGMRMCHMVADSTEELFAMVDLIGVDRKHIQFRGLAKEHFDVCAAMRDKALAAGAMPVSTRAIVLIMRSRNSS